MDSKTTRLVPCPVHGVPPGTACPPRAGQRLGRFGCQVRLWLAQAVVNGKLPRPVRQMDAGLRARFEAMYADAQREPVPGLNAPCDCPPCRIERDGLTPAEQAAAEKCLLWLYQSAPAEPRPNGLA